MHFDMITQPNSINIDFTSASCKKTIQSFPRTTEYDTFPFIVLFESGMYKFDRIVVIGE